VANAVRLRKVRGYLLWEISPIAMGMRNNEELTPLQHALLQTIERLRAGGIPEIHAYGLTKVLEDSQGERRWIGYGSQYRAMAELADRGFVSGRWEDASLAEAEKRPRRRLYAITPAGQRALTQAPRSRPVPTYAARFAAI
jgi:hypothetical protein